MKLVETLKKYSASLPNSVDLVLFSGAALITYGFHRMWPPLGFLSAGAFLLTLGVCRLKGN